MRWLTYVCSFVLAVCAVLWFALRGVSLCETNFSIKVHGPTESLVRFVSSLRKSSFVDQVLAECRSDGAAKNLPEEEMRSSIGSVSVRYDSRVVQGSDPNGALTVVQVNDVVLPGAPDDGLVISTGTSVALDLDVLPEEAKDLISVIYKVRRLRGNGTYTDWEYAAGNYWGTDAIYNPSDGGIYQVQALAGLGWGAEDERYYVWEDYSDYTYGTKVPGDMKAFGVCNEVWQKNVRNSAKNHLGSTAYARNTRVGAYGGFSAVRWLAWKCNIFVAHRLIDCGLPVPAVHDEKWPPLANEWGNAEYVIPGWMLLGANEYPQPGMVAVKPMAGGHGHVGIVDFDGMLISAQEFKVTRASNPVTWPVSPVFRTYKGNE